MHLTLGRVHWGDASFPYTTSPLTQALTDQRFLSDHDTR